MSHGHAHHEPAIHGVVAQFDDSDALVHAAKKAYAAGYRDMDAYSPIPIHGLPQAIGCTKSKVPMLVFIAGVSGAIGGFLLQAVTAAVIYPMDIGGRPNVSWPSFIPITFESAILAAGLTAVVGMFVMNGLPRPHHPIFNAPNFERASCDKFFLCIEATDAKFNTAEVTAFLQGLGPENVAEVPND